MPELPEVETTLRGISPHLLKQKIKHVVVRQKQLRWPVPNDLAANLKNRTVQQLYRRGKYLIMTFSNGHVLLHLGMSGSLRIANIDSEPNKHDHIDWILSNGKVLRFHDPRRFGSVLWTKEEPLNHPLLISLGPEPLERDFNDQLLFTKSRKRKVAVKNFIMNSHIVVGVGNIYASEALFLASIRPSRAAGTISLKRYQKLVQAIKKILRASIKKGGTSLRDFVNEQGNPGYFRQKLNVYGKDGQPCKTCDNAIKKQIIGQRSSFYCSHCQR